MHVRWIFVFSSACGSRARARGRARSTWSRSASTDASLPRERPLRSIAAHRRPLSRKRRCGGCSVVLRRRAKTVGGELRRAPARTGSARSASTTGSARLTAAGTAESSGSSYAIFASSACSMSVAADARRRRPCGWRRARRARASKPSRSIVSSPMRTFFSDVTSGLQTSSSWSLWSSAASIARVEQRPGVDDDGLVRAARRVEHGRELRLADHVGLLGPLAAPAARASPVRGSVLTNAFSFSTSMSPAEAARSAIVARGVTASVSAESPNCRSRSTSSVSHARARSRDREVRREHGLAAAALRREDGHDLARSPLRRCRARRLAEREQQRLGRLRQDERRRPRRPRGRSRRSRSARRRRRG